MEFKEIKDYEGYSISKCGVLKNNNTDRILKTFIGGGGYEYGRIINNLKMKKVTIHSLVIDTFIGNKPLDYEIDHIDRNKKNNRLENLRYISKSDNLKNRNCEGKARRNKKNEYYNIKECKKNGKVYGYVVNIKQKYYGMFKNLEDAINKRNNIISSINIVNV